MYRKQKIWVVAITIGMSLFLSSSVQAETSSNIFSDWQGEFMSREFVNETPEMDAVYKKVVIEAKKLDKNYTKAQVRDILKGKAHTSFCRISLKGDVISFYDEMGNAVEHRYKATGTVPDIFGKQEFEWYVFEAVGKEAENSEYRYILMLKIHQHKNGQPHFHLRYGSKGARELTGLYGIKNWWPTMVRPDFDMNAYIGNLNPKIMARVLP